jgi:pimeloyl-ACP methyl ester carboxylesterase
MPSCAVFRSPDQHNVTQTETIILLHGIYMHGLFLRPLARRLRASGFRTLIFNYPSLRRSTATNAARLAALIARIDADVVHYVGHSLGGLVLHHLMAGYENRLPPGRCVTLGTPHGGSTVARRMQYYRLGWLLGFSRDQALLGGTPDWPVHRELGSLAGIARYGIGRSLVRLPEPHDGTVTVDETRCPGMQDHIIIPGNHTGLLYSTEAARQTVAFLRNGRFDHGMSISVAEC